MGRIISIGTAVPPYSAKQVEILDFMRRAYQDETASRKLNILFHSSGIGSRHSVLADFGEKAPGQASFFDEPRPQVNERMQIYRQTAVPLALDAIQASFRKINMDAETFAVSHLITVSCTGLQAPGLDAILMEEMSLPGDIFHTSVNFAGCNAAFSALKIADMITRTEKNARVLVVCVELCTLHFQPKNNHDNLLSNTIFGDGAASVLMVSESFAETQKWPGLSVDGFYSELLSEGKDLMGWNITPLNFEMVLSAKVPAFIGKSINKFLRKASQKLGVDVRSAGKWAVHPGGRKILDVVKTTLELTEVEMKYSYEILHENGNMSSPTILFIISRILEDSMKPGETILAVGFGPGISIDSALFTYGR